MINFSAFTSVHWSNNSKGSRAIQRYKNLQFTKWSDFINLGSICLDNINNILPESLFDQLDVQNKYNTNYMCVTLWFWCTTYRYRVALKIAKTPTGSVHPW